MCIRDRSKIASDTWSATLSGWPSETDSEVNKKSCMLRSIINKNDTIANKESISYGKNTQNTI